VTHSGGIKILGEMFENVGRYGTIDMAKDVAGCSTWVQKYTFTVTTFQ